MAKKSKKQTYLPNERDIQRVRRNKEGGEEISGRIERVRERVGKIRKQR